MSVDLDLHICNQNESWPEYDAQRIYLCRVCSKCQRQKLAKYTYATLHGYTQADVDERIEDDY